MTLQDYGIKAELMKDIRELLEGYFKRLDTDEKAKSSFIHLTQLCYHKANEIKGEGELHDKWREAVFNRTLWVMLHLEAQKVLLKEKSEYVDT
jgi:hypothetical protein